MKMTNAQLYMNRALAAALNSHTETELGDRASEQGNHSTAQCHYENARKYEAEAIRFDDLHKKECEK